jgi:tetratricopeptide (TPR) repeat protein
VRNRSGKPFTPAGVQPYVDFFDRHGTANDQLLAHYLMGRAYHEQGEAPMALQYYQQAAECADTTAADCDYAQLSRVYGQMADIFYDQALYRQGLQCDKFSELYAWKGKDTLAALMSYEQENYAYSSLGLKDSAIFVIEDVAMKYKKYGYHKNAAICFGLILKRLLEKGEYQKAKNYMDTYESESGFFDSKGNIESGREIYYKAKGLYYLYQFQYDSAEYYFRKELQEGKDFGNQHSGARGLTLLFQRLHKPDSIAKYALYTYDMNDSLNDNKTTRDVKRIQSMYDYSRHQKIAHEEKEKAHLRAVIIWFYSGLLIICCLIFYIVIEKLICKRKEVESSYNQCLSIIEQTQHDLSILRISEETNKVLISEKEQIIKEQNTILKKLLHQNISSHLPANKKLKESVIFCRFEQFAITGQRPTEEEWNEMENMTFHCFVGFKEFIVKHEARLNDKERKTCLLIRMDFKPKVISNMLGVAPSYISSIRTEMLQKLFNISGTAKAFDKMIKDIY